MFSCSFSSFESNQEEDPKLQKRGCYEDVANLFFVNEQHMIYQTHSGDVFMINIVNRQIKWTYKSVSKYPAVAFLVTDSLIWLNELGGTPLVAINFKGKKELSIDDKGLLYSNKIIQTTEGVIACGAHSVQKINFNKAKIDWKYNCRKGSSICTFLTTYDKDNLFVAGIGDSLNYNYDNIVSINKNSGNLNWIYRFKGKAVTELASSDKYVFVDIRVNILDSLTNKNINTLKCLDKISGKLIWEKKHEGISYYSKLLTINNNLYLVSSNVLYALDANNGSMKWSKVFPEFAELSDASDRFIIINRTYGFDVIDASNGELIHKVSRVINAGPWVLGNLVFFYSKGCVWTLNGSDGNVPK